MINQYVEQILRALVDKDDLHSTEISKDPVAIFPAIQRLKGREMIDFQSIEKYSYNLTEQGEEIIANGSPEYNLTKKLAPEGVQIKELKQFSNSFVFAIKNNWVKQENGKLFLVNPPETDITRCLLEDLCKQELLSTGSEQSGISLGPTHRNDKISIISDKLTDKKQKDIDLDDNLMKNMKITKAKPQAPEDGTKSLNSSKITDDNIKKLIKRKLIEVKKTKSYVIYKGPKYTNFFRDLATDLTADMVSNKTYGEYEFKDYNYATLGNIPEKGNLHPISKMRDQMARVFMDMGFCEMHTDRWVESSFWNFDALFQPQNHPSRDSQDTFFVENPLSIDAHPNYVSRVKNIHENGGYDSKGYQNTWDQSEASKLVLRTHTTSVSARYLYAIAQEILKHTSGSISARKSLLDDIGSPTIEKTLQISLDLKRNNSSEPVQEIERTMTNSIEDGHIPTTLETSNFALQAKGECTLANEPFEPSNDVHRQLIKLNSKKLQSVPSILPFLNLHDPESLEKILVTQNHEITGEKINANEKTFAQDSKNHYDFNQKIKSCTNLQNAYKFYSIDKVFRNETADATHLAEFHQIEGVIVGKNLSIGQLMGVLSQFYDRLGLKKLKFKPAYNPYTEPSMEIFGYHDGLQKWIEIGNSGIFRPEMLLPMGFDESYVVFGWGLSLERPTMIKYGINNIRDLVGHKVCLDFIRKSELCIL